MLIVAAFLMGFAVGMIVTAQIWRRDNAKRDQFPPSPTGTAAAS